MILHDFVHEWDGKSDTGEKPITWWPGAYHIRIIALDQDKTPVLHLFPRAVVFKGLKTQGKMNTNLKNHIDNFAKIIARDYDLTIDKTLWIEWDAPPRVAQLTAERTLGDDTLYSISWRPLRPNEEAMIHTHVKDFDHEHP